ADSRRCVSLLRTRYPQPKYDLGSSPEYGFVEILEGTGVRLGGTEDNITLVASSTYRCRACFDPANSESVEVIVPGYGLCKTRLKDPIRFIPDLESSCFERKQYCDRLDLHFDAIENIGMVMDLLKLLFSGLSELSLRHYEAIQIQVDLSVLAAVCPALHELRIQNFNVVVSTHSEALQTWSIKTLRIDAAEKISDVVLCFRNPALQMTQSLVNLALRGSSNRPLDRKEIMELKDQHGRFLPVTKKKFPLLLKVAVISVVLSQTTTAHSVVESKAFHYLDANILSLIFVFASTPAQRSVNVRGSWFTVI
ncbi:hypothetical protein JG688_00011280, partial [Phytophthora aleatoria]